MPYKYNESRRHKIKKSRYRVTNWKDYNNALRRRGDITIWFTEEAITATESGSQDRGVRTQPNDAIRHADLCQNRVTGLREGIFREAFEFFNNADIP